MQNWSDPGMGFAFASAQGWKSREEAVRFYPRKGGSLIQDWSTKVADESLRCSRRVYTILRSPAISWYREKRVWVDSRYISKSNTKLFIDLTSVNTLRLITKGTTQRITNGRWNPYWVIPHSSSAQWCRRKEVWGLHSYGQKSWEQLHSTQAANSHSLCKTVATINASVHS